MNEVIPIPMVAQVEARQESSLPGIDALCRELGPLLKRLRKTGAEHEVDCWRTVRRIQEYAATDAVKLQVELINNKPGRIGRPKQGTRLAMEELAAQGAFPMSTLERWMMNWKTAAERLKVSPACNVSDFDALFHHAMEKSELEPFVERLMMRDEPAPATEQTQPKPPTFEEIAESVKAQVLASLYRDGKPLVGIQTPLMQKLNPALKVFKLELWPITEGD